MLDKLSGQFAPRPTAGPHGLRESLPLLLVIRNRLKYALTARESEHILKSRNVLVDGKVRTEGKFPTGLMDVVEIPATKQAFRVLFDIKGRHTLVSVPAQEASTKLLKVTKLYYTPGRVPCAATHDGRVVRYPDPLLKKGDTLVFDLKTKQVVDWIRFKKDQLVYCTSGANRGRVGNVTKVERHPGSFHIVHVTDATGATFATRLSNIFVIGREESLITLPKSSGIRTDITEDRKERIEKYRAIKEKEVVGGATKKKGGKKQRA